MKKKLTLCFVVFFLFSRLFIEDSEAQNYNQTSTFLKANSVWAFGKKKGYNFNTYSSFISENFSDEGCASVSDTSSGQLLFYSDGQKCYTAGGTVMPNGSGLLGNMGSAYSGGTTAQGVCIVPVPGTNKKYYLFSLEPGGAYYTGSRGRLYYSIVDMDMNGGQGDVVSGIKNILVDSLLGEAMISIPACNKVWLMVHSVDTAIFKAYPISLSGLDPNPVISATGSQINGTDTFTAPMYVLPRKTGAYSQGGMAVSPDRTLIAIASTTAVHQAYETSGGSFIDHGRTVGTLLCRFDPATGTVSDALLIDTFADYSVAFSPDNSKLYMGGAGKYRSIYQFDISNYVASDIIASKDTILKSGGMTGFKLYKDTLYFCRNMSTLARINKPNLSGLAADLQTAGVSVTGLGEVRLQLPNDVVYPTRVDIDTTYSYKVIKMPCYGNGIILKASDTTGENYAWGNGSVGSNLPITEVGIYWVSYIASCKYHIDSFRVVQETHMPDIYTSVGCRWMDNSMIVALPVPGDTTKYTYTWKNINDQIVKGPTLSELGDTLKNIAGGVYILQFSKNTGCDTTLIIDLPLPNYHASFTVSDSIVCMGDTVSFNNSSLGDFISSQWEFGEGTRAGTINAKHSYAHPRAYEVQMIGTTSFPCYDTAYQIIIVDSMLRGSFLTDEDSICLGQSIKFLPQVDSSTVRLEWKMGDGSSMIADNEVVSHAFDSSGALAVLLNCNFRACPETSFTDTVYVYALPLVYLGPDTGLCLNGAPIILQNLRTAPISGYRQLWSTGDTASSIAAKHHGIYSLTVTTEPLGCSTTDVLEINKDCYIDIPNAFTADGDGLNDYFFPRQLLSRKVTAFKMQIFNRWGQLIFETTEIEGRGWDGRFNNKDQPVGVYVYIIDVIIDGYRREHYQGNVTLLR